MTPEQILLIKSLSTLAITALETIKQVNEMSEEEVRELKIQVDSRAQALMGRLNSH